MLIYQIKAAGFLLLVLIFLHSHLKLYCRAHFNPFPYNVQASAPLARNPMATYPHLIYPIPQDKTEVIVVGDKGGDQHHHHHHHHHHKHGHHHHHGHDHSHSHSHNHGHDHKHNHDHGHNHAHNHNHNHGHQHAHAHKHGHGHFHGHKHEHNHGHVHGHKHNHGHIYGNDYGHRNVHGRGHLHTQMHNHLQGHQNEEKHGNDNDHSLKHNQHHSNQQHSFEGQHNSQSHVSNNPRQLSHIHDSEGHGNYKSNSAEQQEYNKNNHNSVAEYNSGLNGHANGNEKVPYKPTFDEDTQDEGQNYADPSHTSGSGDASPRLPLENFNLPLLTPGRSYDRNLQKIGTNNRGRNGFKGTPDSEASFSAVHHLRANGDIVTVGNDDPFISVERPLNLENDDSQEAQESVQKGFVSSLSLTPADDYEASIGKFDEVWNIPLFS